MVSRKRGRPRASDPRNYTVPLRLNTEEKNELELLSDVYGIGKTKLARLAIHEYYINHYTKDTNRNVDWEYDMDYDAYRATIDEEEDDEEE